MRIRVVTGNGVEAQVVAVVEVVAEVEAQGGARRRARGKLVMAQANAALAGLKTG